jgi:sRNA-binding protein
MVSLKRNQQLANARKASAEKKKEEDRRKDEDKRKAEEDSKRKEEEEIVKKGKCDLFGARDQRENINVPIGIGGVQTTNSVVVSGNGSKAVGDNDLHISSSTMRAVLGKFAVPLPRPVVNSQQSIPYYYNTCAINRFEM